LPDGGLAWRSLREGHESFGDPVVEARRMVATFVTYYNTQRLHSAVGYVTPSVRLAGREQEVWAARNRQLAAARGRRRQHHQMVAERAAAFHCSEATESHSR
jgi:hypothetical protein